MTKNKLTSRMKVLFAALALTFLVLGCGGTVPPATSPGLVETIIVSTMQASTPLASATVFQPSATLNPPTAFPTNTSLPPTAPVAANPPPAGTQITFSTGATQGIIQGTIQGGQTLSYYLKASEGQPMITMVSSTNNDVTMSIVGQDGTVLLPASQGSLNWQGTLPSTQYYSFKLYGGSTSENFAFSVNIVARVQFGAGESSATLNGTTVNGSAVSYAVYAFAGQTLEATLNTSPDDAGLTIWGFSDGQPYARAQNGVTTFTMQLPSTQDYIIDVVPQGGRVINYTLNITIK